tara:strand:- start:2111 stop:2560 length:450 start_codon:yes stop_codon:yes gene_type:complete
MQSRRFSRLFLLLAVFAACVQWTIPHGWMVGAVGDGSSIFVPCPTTSPGLASLSQSAATNSDHAHHTSVHGEMRESMDHGGNDADDHGAAQAKCDFAAMGAPLLPPDGPQLAAPPFAVAAVLPVFPDAIPGRGLAAPPPPSTGPPISRA